MLVRAADGNSKLVDPRRAELKFTQQKQMSISHPRLPAVPTSNLLLLWIYRRYFHRHLKTPSKMAKRTKKVGVVGKYGTVRINFSQTPTINRTESNHSSHAMVLWCCILQRYGASLRKQVKKMEITQHARYTCAFCGKVHPSTIFDL